MDTLEIILPAFTVCVLMLLTHSYFGLHVLARGIIFIDLALAQIAALGISIAFLIQEETHGVHGQIYAFAATLLASLLFAKLRHLPSKITREVTIGVTYIVSTALTIIILSRSAQGMEELKSIFNGNILWVSWEDIGLLLLFYALVMALHFVFKQKFIALSFDENNNKQHSFFWEFLFFASFSVVITLAVSLTGILMVFAFLIIPAFSASLLTAELKTQLFIAWGLGLMGSLLGLFISVEQDLPVGATIVAALGLLPIFALFLKRISRRETVE